MHGGRAAQSRPPAFRAARRSGRALEPRRRTQPWRQQLLAPVQAYGLTELTGDLIGFLDALEIAS